MQQYLRLAQHALKWGTEKDPARDGMPKTYSYFGYQFTHDLNDGFPLLTTKEMYWKGIVKELEWFLKGDTNIKLLVDNGVNIWNGDAYNFYKKKVEELSDRYDGEPPVNLLKEKNGKLVTLTYKEFIDAIKRAKKHKDLPTEYEYRLGDCGYQYGKVWRNWDKFYQEQGSEEAYWVHDSVDQLENLVNRLKNNPFSRRHLMTSIDPAHEDELALYWCHALFQLNCRPLTLQERLTWLRENYPDDVPIANQSPTQEEQQQLVDNANVPKFMLDGKLYQRSADIFLGVPFNIASYALLIHILAAKCNMVPGNFIHSFGDAHVYEDHVEQIKKQKTREPKPLPTITLDPEFDWENATFDEIGDELYNRVTLNNYKYHPKIEAKLSTGN